MECGSALDRIPPNGEGGIKMFVDICLLILGAEYVLRSKRHKFSNALNLNTLRILLLLVESRLPKWHWAGSHCTVGSNRCLLNRPSRDVALSNLRCYSLFRALRAANARGKGKTGVTTTRRGRGGRRHAAIWKTIQGHKPERNRITV